MTQTARARFLSRSALLALVLPACAGGDNPLQDDSVGSVTQDLCVAGGGTIHYTQDGTFQNCANTYQFYIDDVPDGKAINYQVSSSLVSGDYHRCGDLTLYVYLMAGPAGTSGTVEQQQMTSKWNSALSKCVIAQIKGGIAATSYSEYELDAVVVDAKYGTTYPASVTLEIHNPCSGGAAAQVFDSQTMWGCAGMTSFASRASVCGSFSHVCTADEWTTQRGATAPGHDYWVNDSLGWTGSGSNNCTAIASGNSCGSSPMRVCVPGGNDLEGNHCNWTGCALSDAKGTFPADYMGGCGSNNPTAGVACCRD